MLLLLLVLVIVLIMAATLIVPANKGHCKRARPKYYVAPSTSPEILTRTCEILGMPFLTIMIHHRYAYLPRKLRFSYPINVIVCLGSDITFRNIATVKKNQLIILKNYKEVYLTSVSGEFVHFGLTNYSICNKFL